MTRKRIDDSHQIPYADLAMALLGPLGLLAIVFMMMAAMSDPRPTCTTPDETESGRLAANLTKWHAEHSQRAQENEERLVVKCGSNPAVPMNPLRNIVPEPIFGVCASHATRILTKANVTQADIDSLINKEFSLAARFQSCLAKVRCKIPSASEIPTMARAVVDWLKVERNNLASDRRLLSSHCSDYGQRVDRRLGSRLDLPPLHEVCEWEIPHILSVARVSPSDIRAVNEDRAEADRAYRICLQRLACETPNAKREKEVSDRLKAWIIEARQFSVDKTSYVRSACGEDQKARDARPIKGVIPEPLRGICVQSAARIIAGADFTQGQIDELEYERSRAERAFLACHRFSTEIVEIKEEELKFVVCSDKFSDGASNRPMTYQGQAEFFDRKAKIVVEKIRERKYNRIDIFGHADERLITGRCANVGDNARLSSMRAHAFRDALIEAIERGAAKGAPQFRDVAARLRDTASARSIRIYAIGVGATEPKRKNAKTAIEHQQNRRTELRFVTVDYPERRNRR